MNPSLVSLITLGGFALFGLQGSLSLAMRHYLFRGKPGGSPCERLLKTPQAYIGPVPLAFAAAVYYLLVLIMLLRMLAGGENPMDLITPLILLSLLLTCYYAWLLFFKLRLRCMGCIRIQLANLLMASACVAYFVL